MNRIKDINWYLEDPTRLMQMKPFTRGGTLRAHGYENSRVLNNTFMETGFTSLELKPVSQDLYITEYRPDLHHIILNKAIPHIKVMLDGCELPTNMLEITQTASFQKLIHSAHVRNLTANPIEFNLCNDSPDDSERKVFSEIKQEWMWREREHDKYMAINTCKQLGNCAMLFSFDKQANRYVVTNYSYEDGYQMTPNYDEYGMEVARSLFYQIDDKVVIDTLDNQKHYRCIQTETGWEIQSEKHGFSRCPLLFKRGKVAWEYAESSIEMWELMANIAAIALKRFGTFALAFWGEMDKNSLQRDSSTLIVNLSSDTTNGKQDVKVLDFPEPQTMDGYLKTLEEKISLFSSTSFITPKDITATNSGGNGIALAMSNDYSLAVQSSLDWKNFVNDMVYLHQEGMDLENNGATKYSKVRIGARIAPWSLETTNTKLVNLGMEAPYLSTQTVLEKCPDAAPDEAERVIKERGSLVSRNDSGSEQAAQKAQNVATNRNDVIIDNQPNDQNV
jgi:hypothetical protein